MQVLALSVQEQGDPAAAMREMRKRHHLTYPIASDQRTVVLSKFGFTGIPANVIIDKSGKYVANPESIGDMVKKLNELTRTAHK